MRRRKRRTQAPVSAFSRAGFLPASFELIVSKKLVTLFFRDELPEILQDSLRLYCFPKGTWEGESGIGRKRKILLSEALALRNVTSYSQVVSFLTWIK